jgi:NAD(P)-dependent dehydrogenase (short-subunit alcohol dehydrogenase family)
VTAVSGRLDGLRVILTGASRGLGRALAEAFAAEGARLVLTATREEHLGSVLRALRERGAEARGLGLDLSDAGEVRARAAEALALLGRVDGLVNNAGLLGVRAPLAEYPLDLWGRVMEVNVTGTLALTQAVIPAMSEGAAIVNVTSGAAGRPGWGAYSISKLAVNGITDILRAELADRRIRCVAVNPGPARTSMRASAYPDEDPATVPHPSSLVEPFVAILEGADPGPRVEAAEWRAR